MDHCSPSPLQHEVIHRGHAVAQLQPVSLTCTARGHLNYQLTPQETAGLWCSSSCRYWCRSHCVPVTKTLPATHRQQNCDQNCRWAVCVLLNVSNFERPVCQWLKAYHYQNVKKWWINKKYLHKVVTAAFAINVQHDHPKLQHTPYHMDDLVRELSQNSHWTVSDHCHWFSFVKPQHTLSFPCQHHHFCYCYSSTCNCWWCN